MYQSYGDKPGASNFGEKLCWPSLPGKLTDKSILGLGYNEGFFALEAKRRGANKVPGIYHKEQVMTNPQRFTCDAPVESLPSDYFGHAPHESSFPRLGTSLPVL